MVDDPSIQITLFGDLRVLRNGVNIPLSSARAPKLAAGLAFLALPNSLAHGVEPTRRQVTRTALIAAL